MSARTTPAAGDAIVHALAAVNIADLGYSNVGELHTLLEAIRTLAYTSELKGTELQDRLDTVHDLAKFAHMFAFDRMDHLGCLRDGLQETLTALQGGTHESDQQHPGR